MLMPTVRDYVFVLWGDKFEEAVAAIFVSELRDAGLRVKVVGLTHRLTNGRHGLALVPDLTLDQVLPIASRAACLVIPCLLPGLKRLKDDPRLPAFFQEVQARGAKVVVGQLENGDAAALGLCSSDQSELIYLGAENPIDQAHHLAASLREM